MSAADRAALIEAMEQCATWPEDLPGILDAVLPLIAKAIDQMPIPYTKDTEKMAWGDGVRHVAVERVRSFMDGGS